MTAPTTEDNTDQPTTTAQDQTGLDAAQIAALIVLVKSQAAVRERLTQTAVRAAVTAFAGITNWWDDRQVQRAVDGALRVVQASQRQAARVTDAYISRSATLMSGARVQPAGLVDVTKLRRDITAQIARDLVDGIIKPGFLVLGDTHTGAGPDINQAVRMAIPDPALARRSPSRGTPSTPSSVPSAAATPSASGAPAPRAQALKAAALDPAVVYQRIAEAYRYQVVAKGVPEAQAAANAAVRVAAAAQTDVTLAVREQYRNSIGRIPNVRGYRRILHPELSKTGPCGLCVVAADRTYHKQDLLPLHARCVPAGTRVAAHGVLAVTRRDYSGVLVVLLTASGQELTITANHPVLTDQGWIPAYLVNEDHHLVRHVASHRAVGRSPHEGDGPPLVEEVWRAATMGGGSRLRAMPLAAEDFHGDWSKSEVDVVRSDGSLSRIGDVSFAKPAGELSLVSGHTGRTVLLAEGGAVFPLLREGNPPDCGIRCGSDGLSLIAGGAGIEVADGLGLSARLNACFHEAQPNHGPLDAELIRQGKFGGSFQVPTDYLIDGQLFTDPTRFDPAFAQFAGEGRHTYTSLGRGLLDRLAGAIELDRVVEQRRVEGTHQVFNLHTVEGWYSANNCIVSNCVCEVLPIIGDQDPGVRLNADDLRSVYEAAGGTGGELVKVVNGVRKHVSPALKRVRVALAEHGELGPVLVDASQQFRGPVQVAKTVVPDVATRKRAQLAALEDQYGILQRRKLAGDNVDRPLAWQENKIRELQVELEKLGASAE